MKKIKEMLKVIIDLKLLKYNFEAIKLNLLYFIDNDLKCYEQEYNETFSKLEKKIDDLYKLIYKLKDQKNKNNNIPNYKIKSNKLLASKKNVFFILLLIILIMYFIFKDAVFLTFAMIILIIINVGLLITSSDENILENEQYHDYEKNLLNIIDNENKLLTIQKEINLNDNLKNEYIYYNELSEKIPIFDNKSEYLSKKINSLIVMIDKQIKIIDSNISMMYIINDIPIKYRNFLADSIFYEYIENSKSKSLDDMFKLFEKEYGTIIGDQKELLNRLSNNKKEQYIDNSKVNEINDYINELKDIMLLNKVLNEELKTIDELYDKIKKIIEFDNDVNNKIIIEKKVNVSSIIDFLNEKDIMKIKRVSNELITIHDDSLKYIYVLKKNKKQISKLNNDTKENIEFINNLLIEIGKISDEEFIEVKCNKLKGKYNITNGDKKSTINSDYILDITSILGSVSYYYDTINNLIYFKNEELELGIIRI